MAEKVTLISDIPVTNDIQDGSKFLLDNSTDGSASVTTMLALKNYILEQLGSSDSIELKDSKFEAKLSEALDNLLEVTADVMGEDGSTIVTKGGLYVGKTVVYIAEADYNTLVTDSKVDDNKLYVILLTKAQETDRDKFKMVLNGKEIAIGSELTGSDSVEIQNDVITARLSEATDNLLKVSADVMDETGDAVVTKGGLYVGNNLVYITEDDYNALVTDSKVDTEKLYVVILNKTAESDPDKFKLVFNGKEIKIADETSNTIEDLTEAEIIELVDAMNGEYTPQSSILVLNMTSNTTPAPYSASASSIYGGDNNAYYAFNAGTNIPWQTANNTPSAWIQLDMGTRTKITSFSITTRTTIPTSAPKDFILYGSDDGASYTEIKAFSNQIGWSVGETRNFDLGGVYNYQIYKLDIITNNGYSFTSVQHIKFYKYTENDSDKNGINKYSLREILADSGIGKKANHANREVLDKFSEGTEVGKLLYNGKEIGTGTSTVEKSETNGNIINNGEELVVYDDTELNKNIANLNARSTLGSELTMFEAMLTDAITVTANTNIPYNNILFNNGGFSLSNGVVSGFKAGRTYEIQAGGLIFNTAGRLDTRVKNISTGEYLSNRSLSNSTSIANSVDSTTTGYFKCVSDTESISIEAIYASGTCTIAGGYPYIKITEVGRTAIYDSVQYTNENIGIEEFQVGSIVTYTGLVNPKHYLKCDGSIYNIVDYPELAKVIYDKYGVYNYFGGDGVSTFAVPNLMEDSSYTDITPIMTSNTTPSPYVASASSISGNDARYNPYVAFNGTSSSVNDSWYSNGITFPQYLMLDFGAKTSMNAFTITINGTSVNVAPKDFTLEVSDDGSTFTVIKSFSETSWVNTTPKTFVLDKSYSYRYYKINIQSNNGSTTYVGISQLRFLSANIENKYIKCEPTYYIHNDKVVYGGFNKETLWEGYLSGATDSATLSKPITDYSLLIVEWNQFTQETPILETLTIEINDNIDYTKQYISMGNIDRYVYFKFSDSTTLTNVGVNNVSGSTVGITRVIGIKTSDTSTDVVYATEEEVTTAINDILNDVTT